MFGAPHRNSLVSKTDAIMESVQENNERVRQQQLLLQQTIKNADNESRKVNAILYGLSEQDEKSVAEQVKEFMTNQCFIHTSEPISAFRLGNKQTGKNRPVKIKFKDEANKWEFLKRVNANFKNLSIFCLLDKSKEVRDEEYQLRQTARKLSSEKPDLHFRARDMKIQVQTHEGEWVDMKKDNMGTLMFTVCVRNLLL